MNLNQYSAIDRSKRLSKIIAEQIPETADNYINNLTLRQIVDKYNIMDKYDITNEEIARSSVSRALKILLSKEELRELVIVHNKNNGLNTLQNRDIVFWTNEEKSLLLKLIKKNINRRLITNSINNILHNGKPVRTNKSINSMIYRLKIN